MSRTVLVTGSTGNLGSAVTRSLIKKDFLVKAASRDPGKIASTNGVQPVRMVFEDPSTFQDAFSGVDSLFLIALPMDPEAPGKLKPIIDKAAALGIEHVVFNSAMGVDQNEEAPLRIVERYLMNSGLSYTILRPNFFMENFSAGFAAPLIKDQNGIFLAASDGKTSFISTVDIGEVAAVAMDGKHNQNEYNLTGPEALDHHEVAKIISDASGREIAYHSLTEEEMLEGARSSGMPEGSVQYLGILYSVVRAGYAAAVTPDVEQLIGRKARTFSEFAQKSSNLWK